MQRETLNVDRSLSIVRGIPHPEHRIPHFTIRI
jgi:hypothetical protein